ncbi:CAP domain-containing protein [Streptomyces sp. NPDC048172]|uniref:CAP domain-containing protein n=1 Tax=Streptomyces sp. NPDC048172 TaxID=3365505 RepID=UPI0037144F1E
MGRHRRTPSAPAPSPVHPGHAAHAAHAEPAPTEVGPRHRGEHRKRGAAPVRTGLLGASAAMAMGAVAVASGLIPGPGGLGGPRGDRVQADGPTEVESPDLPSAPASERASDEESASRGDHRDDGPTSIPSQRHERPERSQKPAEPSATPSRGGGEAEKPRETERPSTGTPDRTERPGSPSGKESGGSGSGPGSGSGSGSGGGNGSGSGGGATASTTPDPETAAEREVLALVNQERAKAGCRPVKADPELADLAGDFSEDMARRGFFDHNTPDGKTPWDRAESRGISGLGGENIARGQANAQSVMDSWMQSPGHKANIVNCDYRTLGVGAHFAEGGPWWTQDFGF